MTVSPPPTDTDRLAEALRDQLALWLEARGRPRRYPEPASVWLPVADAFLREVAAPVVEQMRRESAAEAWDEGYRSGHSNAMRRMSDEPHAPTTTNPYAAALAAAAPTEKEQDR